MSYEESAQEKLERLLAQYAVALLKRQQQTLRGQVNYVDQSPLNELHTLQGTPINPVQRYAPTQPQPLTPPPSQLGLNSIHHMAEARLRAQELSQYQQAPDFQVNPASQKRMFDPYGFVPPQIAENHAEGFDPLAERKARIAEQGQKAQRNYDESLQRRKHLTYPHLSEQHWADIKKEFNQMPIKTYKHLQEKDRVRDVLTAMKTNQPIDWTVDPDTSELLHNWYRKYQLTHQNSNNVNTPGYLMRLTGKTIVDNLYHELFFNGKILKMVIIDTKSKNIEFVEVEATSGKTGHTDSSQKSLGPLPEGVYYFNTQDITFNPLRRIDLSFIPFLDEVNGEWGSYRVPLSPSKETQIFGRDGFFIHGGNRPGSAGCIDLGQKDNVILDPLMSYNKKVKLIVRY